MGLINVIWDFLTCGIGGINKLSFGILDKLAQEYLATLISVEIMNKHHVATVYTLNNPSVIRLEPPLTVSLEQLDFVINAIDEVLSENKSFLGVDTKNIGTACKNTL